MNQDLQSNINSKTPSSKDIIIMLYNIRTELFSFDMPDIVKVYRKDRQK